jgi:hypothetical protein
MDGDHKRRNVRALILGAIAAAVLLVPRPGGDPAHTRPLAIGQCFDTLGAKVSCRSHSAFFEITGHADSSGTCNASDPTVRTVVTQTETGGELDRRVQSAGLCVGFTH